ncbi:MAG: preprotein translocase subunit SecE [Verrucomicrobiota bacterium]
MARQTRAERRARREARERSMAGSPAADGTAAARPALQPAPAPASSRRQGNWVANFIRESIGELRKVEWPSQNHLIQGTVVVIVACVVMGTYLYFADMIFNKLVSKLLLGQ